ncbi:CDP-alcohol phosphatidyltransferase family protein [Sphingomicrobium sediminis]|uniref:CDP-alcohol phosphatidyltransferase family protein n=1 Tax=Sphingomicrobium sediminis TaxID=2950949 RepID=A0A9X2J3Y5_9SPHN|nr:CDP-alcohol phosphatidyltransferase family protein [Sphingomicrobium sediminis]MCM8557786.1 CDP-alcohol phosphatidyltransferase family protein [Sphingomicrobium sediminis]
MSASDPDIDTRPMLFLPVGETDARPYGLAPKVRAYRVAAMLGLDPGTEDMLGEDGTRPIVIQSIDHALDPTWIKLMMKWPGHALCHEGRVVLVHASRPSERIEALRLIEGGEAAADEAGLLTMLEASEIDPHALDQRRQPFVARLDDEPVEAVERKLYDAATPRVSDAISLYVLRLPGFPLTQMAARLGLTANRVTALAGVFSLLAFFGFWTGAFAAGLGAAIMFVLLDTVDGKLAKVTGTSSLWGRRLDAWLDLIHPPFWYVAWMHGLELGTPAFEPVYAVLLTALMIGAYVTMRWIEWWFEKRHGLAPSLWRKRDSWFRLIAARRNINLALLGASLLIARPDLGIQWVAAWLVVTVIMLGLALAEAEGARLRGEKLVSWLEPEQTDEQEEEATDA